MSSIVDFITSILESIVALPELIFEGLKEIFIPDVLEINDLFNETMQDLKNKIGIEVFDLENLFSSSNAPSDVSSSYSISGVGTMNLKFVDYQYLIRGVEFFRPFIRGFIVLLLFFYNIRQLLSMFGLSSGEIESAAKKGSE